MFTLLCRDGKRCTKRGEEKGGLCISYHVIIVIVVIVSVSQEKSKSRGMHTYMYASEDESKCTSIFKAPFFSLLLLDAKTSFGNAGENGTDRCLSLSVCMCVCEGVSRVYYIKNPMQKNETKEKDTSQSKSNTLFFIPFLPSKKGNKIK